MTIVEIMCIVDVLQNMYMLPIEARAAVVPHVREVTLKHKRG